jgi:hypothetical protein
MIDKMPPTVDELYPWDGFPEKPAHRFPVKFISQVKPAIGQQNLTICHFHVPDITKKLILWHEAF